MAQAQQPSYIVDVAGTEPGGYVDWSKNLNPMISAFIDLKKYERQKKDAVLAALLPQMVAAGQIEPNADFASRYGSFGIQPSGADNPIKTLRTAEAQRLYSQMTKDQTGAALDMAKIDNMNQMGTVPYMEGYDTEPIGASRSPSGVTMDYAINPKAPPKQPNLIERFFGKKAEPVATGTTPRDVKRSRLYTVMINRGWDTTRAQKALQQISDAEVEQALVEAEGA